MIRTLLILSLAVLLALSLSACDGGDITEHGFIVIDKPATTEAGITIEAGTTAEVAQKSNAQTYTAYGNSVAAPSFFWSDYFYGILDGRLRGWHTFGWILAICPDGNLFADSIREINFAFSALGPYASPELIHMFRDYHGITDDGRRIRENVMSDVRSVVAVTATNNVSLNFAIRNDNTLWAWGHNQYGQLGLGEEYYFVLHPQLVKDNVASVSVGGSRVYAITVCGNLYWWGGGLHPDHLGESTCTPLHLLDNVRSVQAGALHSFAIRTDDSLWAWGMNENGQIGCGTREDVPMSSPVKIMENVVYVTTVAPSAGPFTFSGLLNSSFAITSDGGLYGWGQNDGRALGIRGRRLGIDETADLLTPVRIMDGVQSVYSVFPRVSFGISTFVIKYDNSLWHFGNNSIYAYNGEYSDGSTPVMVMENANTVWVDVPSHASPIVIDNSGVAWEASFTNRDENWNLTFGRFESTDVKGIVYLNSEVVLMADGSVINFWGEHLLPPGSVRVPPMRTNYLR